MRRIGFFMSGFVLLALGVVGSAFLAGSVLAAAGPNNQVNADYSGQPPFVSKVVPPNVLILMDNSGSMGIRAYCGTSPTFSSNATCTGASATFVAATTYTGMFDPMKCYLYDAGNTRFEVSILTTKAAINTACGGTEWDGNFLNWLTLRRFDAVKKAMIGGSCLAARAADGSCPTSGTPAKITLKAQAVFSSSACCRNVSAPGVPNNTTVNGAVGRVPLSVRTSKITPTSLRFVVRGNPTPLAGFFCVADAADAIFPAASCQAAAGGYTEQQFAIHIAVDSEPAGVAQDLGDKARFGLMEFAGNEGAKVLTPIGARQSVDFTSTSAVTYNTNKAALIAAVETSFPKTNTPLGESLYEGIRYIAQIESKFSSTVCSNYCYPIAFSGLGSGGANFGNAGAGSLGTQEITALTGIETCPSGYITNACGRDPYFFGSNHTPPWASPSQVVTCCKTFIIVFTDGEPTEDVTSESSLQDYAHADIPATTGNVHGRHCTGSLTPVVDIHAPNGSCNNNPNTPPSILLGEHKKAYPRAFSITSTHHLDDIAYWGHLTDLRQANIPLPDGSTLTGHDLSGVQNVTVYSLFAFGNINGREILMQAARQGGFEDSNENKRPDLTSEYDRVDNTTGLLAPDGIPDTYFESQNVDDLKDKLVAAISSILQKAASGTSVSVLATSSTGEGAIYQAYFFPSTFVTIGSSPNEVLWTGFAQGLFIDKFGNLREDYSAPGCTGPPDGMLVLTHDCIIKIRLDTDAASLTFGQVLIDRFKDDGSCVLTTPASCAAGDGIADTTTPFDSPKLTEGGISNVQPIWEAGRQLALLDPGASCELQSTNWPKTGNLTESGRLCRRILTWADISGGGDTSSTELLEFSAANVATLCPYLGGVAVLYCNGDNATAVTAGDISGETGTPKTLTNCLGKTRQTCARDEATGIINFVRGNNVTGLRGRTMNVINTSGAQVQKVWKLGDIINSTPIVVGAPKERYDVIYGDAGYASYFQRYKDRRQVAYVGANDGMLHAFNAGFFSADGSTIDGTGPTVQVRFSTTPKVKGTSTACAKLPCDAAVTQYDFRSDAPALGAELWGYIPQDLLPQLRWMTGTGYDHVYYVDLKPKITDARIFTADADHPGGWGTILIGGFRMGGSCSNCGSKGTPRVVSADFGGGTASRVFLSSYFVLDITNPEKEPTLLWTFRDKDLGFTTAAPAVLRVSPAIDSFGNPQSRTDPTGEKWYALFGTGPTHHDGFSGQTGKVYAVDLKLSPVGAFTSLNRTSGTDADGTACSTTLPCIAVGNSDASQRVRIFSTGAPGSFMGDIVTLDSNLDFRVDAIYAGYTRCNGATATSSACSAATPQWTGAMWRLTTNSGNTDPDTWGIAAGTSPCPAGSLRCPTKLLSALKASVCTAASTLFTGGATACNVGPVTAAAALTSDDTNNLWVLFGTGRFLNNSDKSNVDIQHYFGVKDSFLTGGSPAQTTERNNLFNSSNIVSCVDCAAGANVSTTGSTGSFTTSFDQLVTTITNSNPLLNMDGWFTVFNDCSTGSCALTAGERNLNPGTLVGGTLFFTTFTPDNDICTASGTGLLYAVFFQTGGPHPTPALGTTTGAGGLLAKKSVSLGEGLPSNVAIHLGGLPPSCPSPPCSRVCALIQTSTAALEQTCPTTAKQPWSRMLSWRDL